MKTMLKNSSMKMNGLSGVIILPVMLLLILSCMPGNEVPIDDYNTWTFSGYVVDGYTGQPLSDVSILYRLEKGDEEEYVTNSTGSFYINDLPFGERSFNFKYSDDDSLEYTEKMLVVSNWAGMNAPEGEVGDASIIVKLFPLQGKLQGNVMLNIRENSNKMPAESTLVSVIYNNDDMENASPARFEVITNEDGEFEVDGLPLASGAILSVGDVVINKSTYKTEEIELPEISNSSKMSTGVILLNTNDSTDWLINSVESNILTKDGFGLTNVPVDIEPWFALGFEPDTDNLSVTIEGGGNTEALIDVNEDTVFVDPVQLLTYGDTVTVTLKGKDVEGKKFELKFDGVKRFTTENGIIPLASNMWNNSGEKIAGYHLKNVLWIKFSEKLDEDLKMIDWFESEADIDLIGNGSKSNADVWIENDTFFIKPSISLKPEFGQTIGFKISVASKNGKRSNPTDYSVKLAESDRYGIIASNVLTEDGFGLSGIPVDISPYYVLSVLPEPKSIEVIISGGGNPEAIVDVDKDTIKINPVKNFTYNEMIAITITGSDKDGNRIYIKFEGDQLFKTEQGMFAVASNTWDAAGNSAINFKLYDTMWVVFSEWLDEDIDLIEWDESEADNDIYGNGNDKNAKTIIKDDTLFVIPDARLSLDYGQTTGFKISVLSENGKRSEFIDLNVKQIENNISVLWTNTKDSFGKMRNDFGVMDEVILVSSIPISKVTAISEVEGVAAPPDMTLDNIKVSNDTIRYTPKLRMEPDTEYGMDFNVTFKNGIKRTDVLPVMWQTSIGINITSVNNRENGQFRPFKVINDSLVVVFSKEVNTNDNASVPFRMNCQDVNGYSIATSVKWNGDKNKATIKFLDSLPLADYDASPAYTLNATGTRAINSITFDLTTEDGEQVFKLTPKNETIEIHTEIGLCPLASNIIAQNDEKKEITGNEVPITDFSSNNNITITFNRQLDTAQMKLYGKSIYAGIKSKENGLQLPCTVTFKDKGKTLVINPVKDLSIGKEYYVWIKNVPGYKISGAKAINDNSGTYTGKVGDNHLLSNAFRTSSPDISKMDVTIENGKSTLSGVYKNRIGTSSGFTYSNVVGNENVNVESSIKFQIIEAAWHENHNDSVEGYQVQVQRIDRSGSATNWYDYDETIETVKWASNLPEDNYSREVSIKLNTASFYSLFLTADNDGSSTFYQNSSSLFNDSSRIAIRVRPYIGTGDAGRNEVGNWSEEIFILDNVAPCDSDFVTSNNVNSLARGGVQIAENVNFDNSSGSYVNNNGYIDITFPEDMDPNGPEPAITFFYGPFDELNQPTESLETLAQSNWITARKYRLFISVPVFDYTHSESGSGAYYTISVAGCKDASGNAIQSYGTNGSLAESSIEAEDRKTRAEATAEQEQGSKSIVNGFTLCN